MEAKKEAKKAKDRLIKEEYNVITPFDICPEKDMPYSFYIGKDIMTLLECDTIYFLNGWEKSRGCLLEYSAAKIYNKEMMFEKTDKYYVD